MKIYCTYKELLPITQLSIDMVKTLKVRTNKGVNEEVRRLLEYGFLTPVFVWKNDGINEVIDGVGRVLAVGRINQSLLGIGSNGEIQEGIGEKIDGIPVVYIEAETREEAKKKVLLANSMFGRINPSVLDEYAGSSGESAEFIKCHQSFFEIASPTFDTGVVDEAPTGGEDDAGFEVNLDELLSTEAYSPTFDTGVVDEDDIKTAEKKIKQVAKRDPKQLIEITCHNCGHTFSVGE